MTSSLLYRNFHELTKIYTKQTLMKMQKTEKDEDIKKKFKQKVTRGYARKHVMNVLQLICIFMLL